MRRQSTIVASVTAAVLCAPCAGEVVLFWTVSNGFPSPPDRDREGWFRSVAAVTTIGFGEVPGNTFITDEYLDLGVLFTDGLDITRCCDHFCSWPVDGAGLDGEGPVHLSFTVPQYYIAIDFPGGAGFELYQDGRLFSSTVIGLGGDGNFGGVISSEPFDEAVIFRYGDAPSSSTICTSVRRCAGPTWSTTGRWISRTCWRCWAPGAQGRTSPPTSTATVSWG
jgi:hypothetical protein